ncbi:inward rectifier potassium channel 13-like [Lampetra fluviatilis]
MDKEDPATQELLAMGAPSSVQRLVNKDGSSALASSTRPSHLRRYLRDIWTTLVEMQWRYMFLVFSLTFIVSWLLFGCLWYLLALVRGDLDVDPDDPPPDRTVCVKYMGSMTAAFSFALETQLTIGYGTMYPNGDCVEGVVLLAVQMLLGLMTEALITGAFVAKIARPKLRAGTIRFSGAAVVWGGRGDQRRPRRRLLAFRVANLRPSALLDVAVSAVLYRSRPGRPLRQSAVDFQLDRLGARPCPYFLFPLTFHHELGPDSPLLPLLREPCGQEKSPVEHFELVVFLQAMQEGSGQIFQKRTSYVRGEILLDACFRPVMSLGPDGTYATNMACFDETASHGVDGVALEGLDGDETV